MSFIIYFYTKNTILSLVFFLNIKNTKILRVKTGIRCAPVIFTFSNYHRSVPTITHFHKLACCNSHYYYYYYYKGQGQGGGYSGGREAS